MIIQNRQYTDVDGIKIFDGINPENEDYDQQGLDNLYAVERSHFWFLARNERIATSLQKFIPLSARIMEVGAGTGAVARSLMAQGYNIAVGEFFHNGLKYAQSYGIKECYQFDIYRSPFEDEFNAVCLFDVLEHLDDELLALSNISNMLKKEGCIILTVPAHHWLWNRSDAIAHHKRRYTKKDMADILEKANFEIIENAYFFSLLLPLFVLRACLNQDSGKEVTDAELHRAANSPYKKINPLLNTFCKILSKIDNRLFSGRLSLPFGPSLITVARKK